MELDAMLSNDPCLAEMVVQEKRQCDQELRNIEVDDTVIESIFERYINSVTCVVFCTLSSCGCT